MQVPKSSRLVEVRFKVLTDESARKQSVTTNFCDVSSENPVVGQDGLSIDCNQSGREKFGTVFDPRMGSDTNGQQCRTCHKVVDFRSSFDCCGHFGHISLVRPQIWPLFSSELVRVLDSVCPCCSRRIERIEKFKEPSAQCDDNFDDDAPAQDDDASSSEDEDSPAAAPEEESEASSDEASEASSEAGDDELADDPTPSEDDESEGPPGDDDDVSVPVEDADYDSDFDALDVDDILAPTPAAPASADPRAKVQNFFRCSCWGVRSNVRFKYYCKTSPDPERARYMEVKISAKTNAVTASGKANRVEVTKKFVMPPSVVYGILERITDADFRDIFLARYRDFPRGDKIPYRPTDLMVSAFPVIPTIARSSKYFEGKSTRCDDTTTKQYNGIIAKNALLRNLLSAPTTGKKTARRTKRRTEAGTVDDEFSTDTLMRHLDALVHVYTTDPETYANLQELCKTLRTVDGVPVGYGPEYKAEEIRAERALSSAVSSIMDRTQKGGAAVNLLQRLQGKSGRFRANLAGKRVNYTARTVITPDPNHELDEVSIPYSFAQTLTVPVHVNKWNAERVKQLVLRGKVQIIVETKPSGQKTNFTVLPEIREKAAERVKPGVVVHRFLQNGDYIIMNRQPTLHKPSMIALRVNILPPVETSVAKYHFGSVIRTLPKTAHIKPGSKLALMEGFSTKHDNLTLQLNLSVTRGLNADFDGDEMNLHVTQTDEARAELEVLMGANKLMGSRFIGIVQDTLAGAYMLSDPSAMLTEEFATWVFAQAQGRYPDLVFPAPAILKPKKLWTGKQMLSVVFQHIADDFSYGALKMDDFTTLVVHRGHVVSGRVKKEDFGEKGVALSVINTNFGCEIAADVINHFQAVVNPWVLRRGISVGIKDCIPSQATRTALAQVKTDFQTHVRTLSKSGTKETDFVALVRKAQAKIEEIVVSAAKKEGNRILEMSDKGAGSKGSAMNLVQIQGAVGQQYITGRRPFSSETRRVFPHDPLGDSDVPDLESRGLVIHSLFEGLKPREYYSHAAGGREGIIDTGIKTSRTGYSTRRLACVTEGAVVNYKGAVFNQSILKSVLTSTLYGGDGIDSAHTVRQFMKLHTIPVEDIAHTYLAGVPRDHPLFPRMLEQLMQDRALLQEVCVARQDASESFMLPVDLARCIETTPRTAGEPLTVEELYDLLFKHNVNWFTVYRDIRSDVGRQLNGYATKLFRINLRLRLLTLRWSAASMWKLMETVHKHFRKAIVHPGEPVGLIATQSLMQATMQATLNTFHTAGTGAGAAATGGLNYFDALISCQSPKITTTTIVLADPSKEFMVMDAVAPPVTLCDVVESVVVHATPPPADADNPFSLRTLGLVENTKVIDFVLSPTRMVSHCVVSRHLFRPLAAKIGGNHVEVLADRVRVYVPLAMYARSIVEDLFEVMIKTPRVTPRGTGKSRAYRGVTGARRVRMDQIVVRDGNLERDSFVAIEVYGNFKLADVFCIEGVDCKRTWCNDVHEIEETLGTAAARKFMYRELFNTVTGSGSKNVGFPRYIMQLVDYMAWTGKFEPITRHGMKLFGPMKSAAFEQPGKVLVQAALNGKTDYMLSPTANVMFGQEIRGIGTAICDAVLDESLVPDMVARMETSGPAEGAAEGWWDFGVSKALRWISSGSTPDSLYTNPCAASENPFEVFA